MATKIQTSAISIQRYPYAETSQILHFLTEDEGRIGVIARGAYRNKNSYQGPVDLLVRGIITVSMATGAGLGLLLGRQVETQYPRVRRSLARFVGASHLLRLMALAIPVSSGAPEHFRLLNRALLALETIAAARIPMLLLSFDLHFLKTMGLTPSLLHCVRCSKSVRLESFRAAEGGVVCRSCRTGQDDGIVVGSRTLRMLQRLQTCYLDRVEQEEERVLQQARNVLDQHLAYALDWPPVAFQPVASVTQRLAWTRPSKRCLKTAAQ